MRADRVSERLLVALGIPVAIWVGLLLTPVFDGAREQLLERLSEALANPFDIEVSQGSVRGVLAALCAYALGVAIFFATRRNWRRREEHGSAQWGDVKALCRRYRQRPAYANRLLTRNFFMGMDGKRHRRNLNTLVVGGSGAGKTRSYCLPNIMQANSSLIILDPKGVRPDRM